MAARKSEPQKEIVQKGWPQEKEQVEPEIREYWPYGDEIAVQDGVLYKRPSDYTCKDEIRYVGKDTLCPSWN